MVVKCLPLYNKSKSNYKSNYSVNSKYFISYLKGCEYANKFSCDELIDEINQVNESNCRLTIKRRMRILLSSYLFSEYYYLFCNNTNCIKIDNVSYSLNCIYPRELVLRKTDTNYIFVLRAIPINENCEEDYTIDKENNRVDFKSSDILLELKFKITDIDLVGEDRLLFNLLMNYLEFQESEDKSL